MDEPSIENGAIAVSRDRITDVGTFDEIKTRNCGEIVDLGEQALLPGLINAHCHLDYCCLRGKIGPQESFTGWIRAINAQKTKLSPKDYVASINEGFAEAARFGTTTIANLTAFPELISQIQPPIRTSWLVELIDIRAPERANEFINAAVESIGRARPPGAPWGLAPHALFTASRDLYCRAEEIAQEKGILLTTHLAESREEMQMFQDASGPLYEFLKSLGRAMDDCGGQTPLARFVAPIGRGGSPNRPKAIEVNRPYLSWIVAHLNEVNDSDFQLLERLNSKFHIVHCPRSHDYFGHSPFAFERLRSLGFNICLGTDSLASNESLSLFAEMRSFQKMFPSVSPEDILRMVTVNPATSLHQENGLGRISPGFQANFVTIPCYGSTDVLEEIIAFEGSVSRVIVNGKDVFEE